MKISRNNGARPYLIGFGGIVILLVVVGFALFAVWQCDFYNVYCLVRGKRAEYLNYSTQFLSTLGQLGTIAAAGATVYLAYSTLGQAKITRESLEATTLRPRLIFRAPVLDVKTKENGAEANCISIDLNNNGGAAAYLHSAKIRFAKKEENLPILAPRFSQGLMQEVEINESPLKAGHNSSLQIPITDYDIDNPFFIVLRIWYSSSPNDTPLFETSTFRIYSPQSKTFRRPGSVDDADYEYQT